MQDKITLAIDALASAAFVEGGVSPENTRAARDLTEQRKRELLAAIGAPCLHQIQEPAAAEQAAWHAGLDEGRAQAAGQELKAQHSTACLYGYALSSLGLTDTPQMRVLFWDAHEALEWDENTDRYITPSAEGECGQCGHVQEPASSKAAPAAVAVPVKLATGDEIRAIATSVSTSSSDSPSSSEYVMAGYRAALAATPAAAPVPEKVIEALEMLWNGALNVAMNAKNRGDGYDEGYANAMAKMARETLESLTGTFARPPNPDERGWICQHKKYGTWFLPWRAIADDWKRYDAVHGKGSREPDDKTVQTWWNEQCGWIEVCAYGTQLSRPDMDAHEAAFKEAMAADYNRPQQQEEVNHA